MKLEMFSVRDTKTGVFMNPFCCRTPGEAERSFKDTTNNPETMLCRYPEDYDLYAIGYWDDMTGKIENYDTPRHLVKAVQVKNPVEKATEQYSLKAMQ